MSVLACVSVASCSVDNWTKVRSFTVVPSCNTEVTQFDLLASKPDHSVHTARRGYLKCHKRITVRVVRLWVLGYQKPRELRCGLADPGLELAVCREEVVGCLYVKGRPSAVKNCTCRVGAVVPRRKNSYRR